jgi:acyl-CoA thioester hydrolase
MDQEESFTTSLQLRIDWSELDYFKHVNNVTFFKYIQASRVHYWEHIGLAEYHLKNNIGPMLASCQCDFKRPLFFPGNVTIEARLAFIKNTSFGLYHRLLNDQGEIAAEARDVMVMFDFNKNHKIEIPEFLRKQMTK